MKIRHIDLGEHPVLLAPMEDVTDPAFRLMCKKVRCRHGIYRIRVGRCPDTFGRENHAKAEHQ